MKFCDRQSQLSSPTSISYNIMASAPKTTTATAARRKSNLKQEIKPSQIITLKLSPEKLRKFAPPDVKKEVKEEPVIKESPSAIAPAESAPASDGLKISDSTTSTLPTAGTPLPLSSMPPPTEGVKKKGVKRGTAALTADGLPKVRGKPGPKKRPRLYVSINHLISHLPLLLIALMGILMYNILANSLTVRMVASIIPIPFPELPLELRLINLVRRQIREPSMQDYELWIALVSHAANGRSRHSKSRALQERFGSSPVGRHHQKSHLL